MIAVALRVCGRLVCALSTRVPEAETSTNLESASASHRGARAVLSYHLLSPFLSSHQILSSLLSYLSFCLSHRSPLLFRHSLTEREQRGGERGEE